MTELLTSVFTFNNPIKLQFGNRCIKNHSFTELTRLKRVKRQYDKIHLTHLTRRI